MDLLNLLIKYGVDICPENHRHYHPQWIHVECPFCSGNPGYHMGFPLDNPKVGVCWRCGVHPLQETLSALLNIPESRLYLILKQSTEVSLYDPIPDLTEPKPRLKGLKMPSNTMPLQSRHKNYLIKRGFDPEKIEREWNICGTGITSRLDHIDYRNRILAPIYWNNRTVSFQTRDITGKTSLRYITCPRNRELLHHKHILYGNFSKQENIGICVEGITDVWRLGTNSFSTFGIKYTMQQVKQMCSLYNQIVILFDSEPQAQEQARILMMELRFRGKESWIERIEDDPASLPQKEADYIVKQIINKK